jgi:hypothetical protein
LFGWRLRRRLIGFGQFGEGAGGGGAGQLHAEIYQLR